MWQYEGETNGFRVLHLYLPRSGTLIALGVKSTTAPSNDQLSQLAGSVYRILHAAHLA